MRRLLLAVCAFVLLLCKTLAHTPKSKFVENVRSLKIRYLRQFICVKLRIAGEVCKNLPFTLKCA